MEILDESTSGARIVCLLAKSWRFGVDSPDLEATLSFVEGGPVLIPIRSGGDGDLPVAL